MFTKFYKTLSALLGRTSSFLVILGMLFSAVGISPVSADDTYLLSVTRNGSGTVTSEPAGIDCGATCSASFTQNTLITLTATPDPGSTFIGWSEESCTGTGTCQATMDTLRSVTANFVQDQFTLTINSEHGTVDKSPDQATYSYGDEVTLSVIADPGWNFSDWTPSLTDGKVTINGNTTVTANFTEIVQPPLPDGPLGPDNVAPIITGQTTLTTPKNTPLTITFADLIVTDPDNSYPTGFTLTVMAGTNYTFAGTIITPVLDYVGTLTVPVKVNDGAADSNTFPLAVTVTPTPITYYVNNTISCNDLGAGTSAGAPFCTIVTGTDHAINGGDIVHVMAGTYAEVVKPNSGYAGHPITVQAEAGVVVTGPSGNHDTGGAFRITSKSYIVVSGFTITNTEDSGIILSSSDHITLSNNHVSYSGTLAFPRYGISLIASTNSTISGNLIDHNTLDGINLFGSSNNTLSNNTSFGNAEVNAREACGINLYNSSNNNTIIHNITYANEDTGLNFYTGSNHNQVIGNVTYGNGDHGIDNNDAPNNVFIGNTVVGNVTTGINLEGGSGSGGGTLINNITVDNGLLQQVGGGTSPGNPGNIRVDAQSIAGTTLDYNMVFLNSGTVQFVWGTTSYTSLAAFQADVPTQEVHGLQADPLLAIPAPIAQRPAEAPWNIAINLGDYHITGGSPAIDSANSNAPGEAALDLDGLARVDDPTITDTGAGVRTFDDRGAYEYQPSANLPPSITEGSSTSITMSEDGAPTPFSLTLHASDPDVGDTLYWSVASPLHGSATAAGTGTSKVIGYTPLANYNGSDSFIVRVSDHKGGLASITVNVTITPETDTYYVDNTIGGASDSNAGTSPSAPFLTISKGASVAFAGDVVRVEHGTYAETVRPNSGYAGYPVTIQAVAGVVVTGPVGNHDTGGAFRILSGSYIVVDGFTVTGTDDSGIVLMTSDHITLSNNHVSYSGTLAFPRPGIYLSATTDSTVSGNTTDHNTGDGIRLITNSNNNTVRDNISFGNAEQNARNACGINVLTNSNNNTIIHNITYANEDTGLNFYTGSNHNQVIGNVTYSNGDHGIDNNDAPNNVFIGNTVVGNVTAGINLEGTALPGSGGGTLINNITVDNGLLREIGGGTTTGNPGNIRVDDMSLVGTTLDYNMVFLNSGTVQFVWGTTSYTSLAAFQAAEPTQEVHGLQADPLLAEPAPIAQRPALPGPFNVAINLGDYHITGGSPAIDSANSNAPGEAALDLDGLARVDDPTITDTGAGVRTFDDRGAYEYQPSANLPPSITEGSSTSITMSEDGAPTPFSLTLHASDPDVGDTLYWSVASPLHGSATAAGTGTSKVIGYTPLANYNGSDSFIVRVSDHKGGLASITVNVTITPETDTYYVDNTIGGASDSNAGTSPSAPFLTISKGASVAFAGDIVHVLHGTYAERVLVPNSGVAGFPITFQADAGVVMTGQVGTPDNGGAFRIISQGYIVVDGFTITGTEDSGFVLITSNHITLSHNHVSNSGSTSNPKPGIYLGTTTDSTISNNTTDHNFGDGIRLITASNNNTVRDNISFGNAEQNTRSASGIAVLSNSNNNTIIHNTTYANEDTGLNFYTGSNHNQVIGNLSYGNGNHGINSSDAPDNAFIGNTVAGNVTAGINLEGASGFGELHAHQQYHRR